MGLIGGGLLGHGSLLGSFGGGGGGGGSGLPVIAQQTKDTAANRALTVQAFGDIPGAVHNQNVVLDVQRWVLIQFQGVVQLAGASSVVFFDINIDGARVGDASAGLMELSSLAVGEIIGVSMSYLIQLAAGAHVIKPQYKVTILGNATLLGAGGNDPSIFETIAWP